MEERFRALFKEPGFKYHDVSLKLLVKSSEAKARAELSKKNKRLVEEHKDKLQELHDHLIEVKDVAEVLKRWRKDLEDYNASKRAAGLRNIHNIMELSKNVIQNSMDNIKLTIDGQRAYVVVGDEGWDVESMEGSGILGLISMMLCRMVIKSNPDLLQFMILDEPLSKISEETADILATYMPYISNGMQIIWIEHKSALFKEIPGIQVYEFMLNEKGESIVNKMQD